MSNASQPLPFIPSRIRIYQVGAIETRYNLNGTERITDRPLFVKSDHKRSVFVVYVAGTSSEDWLVQLAQDLAKMYPPLTLVQLLNVMSLPHTIVEQCLKREGVSQNALKEAVQLTQGDGKYEEEDDHDHDHDHDETAIHHSTDLSTISSSSSFPWWPCWCSSSMRRSSQG